jgi:hypothetical protein
MSGMPTTCSNCRRTFSSEPHGAHLAHVEAGVALCDRCVWFVDHPELRDRPRIADRQPAAA